MQRLTQVRTFDDGQDQWRMVDAAPDEAIRSEVQAYGWWSESTASFDTRRELAGTEGTLIINLASDLELVDAKGHEVRLRAGEGFVAGLAQGTSLSRSTGAMEGVHMRAPLSSLARIAGTSIAELTDRVVPISNLPDLRKLHLGERLLDARGDCERWALLDHFVGKRLESSILACPAIAHIARGLRSGIRVEALAAELDWSRKRLARTFAQATGLEPRAFAGLARFERFARQLQAEPCLSLADAAVAAGYADQSHLTREVSRYAGTTPAALRRRLLPAGGGVRD